jgi:uncharacterized membrane protein HdeD (DUF308 family)
MPAHDLTEELKKRSAWSIFMGVLTAALGAFLIIYPLATATITTVLLGWVLIFVGIALFVFARHSQTVGNFLLKILLSLIGVLIAAYPIMPQVSAVGSFFLILMSLTTVILSDHSGGMGSCVGSLHTRIPISLGSGPADHQGRHHAGCRGGYSRRLGQDLVVA